MKKIIFAAIFFIIPLSAHAATLRFVVPTGTISTGDTFTVQALIDATTSINAYDVTVQFAGPIVLQKIDTTHSIISFWQTNPVATEGAIPLRGGSFAPFQGTGGELATLFFRATATGTASVLFENSVVYLADGQGTQVTPVEQSVSLQIATSSLRGGTSTLIAALGMNSLTAPSSTSFPTISFFDIVSAPSGQKLISFLATDATSGIKETDVRFRTGFIWSAWRAAASYAPIPNGAWAIELRAVNNDGGMVERTAYNWMALALCAGECAAIIIILLGIIFSIAFIQRKRSL